MTRQEAVAKGSKIQAENRKKELQLFIDIAIQEGYSGNYAIKLARERRKKILKRLSPMMIEFWMNKGLSEEEAKYKIKSQRKINKEYWVERGFSDKETIEKIKEFQTQQSKKVKIYKSSTQKEYWIERGFSDKEAKEKLKERQAIGRLDKFVERYGKEEGRKRWEERQAKWQKTLQDKTPEEKERINKLKGITLENMIRKWGEIDGTRKYYEWYNKRIEYISKHDIFYSKISQDLFYKLLNDIEDKENVKFATHNNEKVIQKDGKRYMYDFCYKRKIIEFNGDVWHANPLLYKENDKPNPYLKNLSSKDIWNIDEQKNNIAKNKGYKIFIVWEKAYRENKDKIVSECLTFLK